MTAHILINLLQVLVVLLLAPQAKGALLNVLVTPWGLARSAEPLEGLVIGTLAGASEPSPWPK